MLPAIANVVRLTGMRFGVAEMFFTLLAPEGYR
jgi:hypothetical protein